VLALAGCGHKHSGATHATHGVVGGSNAPWRKVINDWYVDGRIDHRYSCATLHAAVDHLPVDGLEIGAPIRAYARKNC